MAFSDELRLRRVVLERRELRRERALERRAGFVRIPDIRVAKLTGWTVAFDAWLRTHGWSVPAAPPPP